MGTPIPPTGLTGKELARRMTERNLASARGADSTCLKNAFLLNLLVDCLGIEVPYKDKDHVVSNGDTKEQLFKALIARVKRVRKVKLKDIEAAHKALILSASRALVTHCLYGSVGVNNLGMPLESHEDSSVL